ncbi:MAG: hypothetical protein ACR2P1_01955 [Pseudomonadales bacterium]
MERYNETHLASPNGFALGPDSAFCVTQNQLQAHPALNQGKDDSVSHYGIVKLKP